MEIGPRTSWAKCFTFLYETFVSKVNGNTPGLHGPIPLRFFIKSLLKVNGNALGACWANDLPANQPINQPTNQPTSQPPAGLAGLGWAGWAVLARLANMC